MAVKLLSKILNFPDTLPAEMDEDVRQSVLDHVKVLDGVVAEILSVIRADKASRRYSPSGLREVLHKVGHTLDERLAKLWGAWEGEYQRGIAKAMHDMTNPARGTMNGTEATILAVRQAAREREIRDHLRTLDSNSLTVTWIEAMEGKHYEVADAITNDPLGQLRLAPSPAIEKLKFARLASQDPEAGKRHAEYTAALRESRSALAHARNALKAEGLDLPSLDPKASAA